MNINTKKILAVASGIAMTAIIALPAFAQTNNGQTNQINRPENLGWQTQGHGRGTQPVPPGHKGDQGRNSISMRPVISGIVIAVSGNTVTITGRTNMNYATTSSTYTVNATNAVVRKSNATSTVSNIAVGDRIFVQGSITGTSITATTIYDSVGMMGDNGSQGEKGRPGMASSTTGFMGNGQPVIAGTVTVINGTTLTVTTMSSTTYTIDASNAKVLNGATTVALSTVTVGQRVIVQGTINGSSVTATTIHEQVNDQPKKVGFFGSVGGFFKHLFGF